MSISLGEAIGQAQAAFDSGDYRSVVESCSRILDQYPHYAGAQRLLGQAYLEQGQPGEAESWFVRLLAHDPREASAYLGLGLIAEDRGVLDNALAYCQVAWELAPEQARFRESITRVAEKRYGVDGKLRLTHAALAQIHANARRLRRAVKEYQSALIALPDRIDLWMGLAETLWQLGEDDDAAEIAREFLKEHPDLARALALLADIEHRAGNAGEAAKHRDRLRRIDPDGVIAAALVAMNRRADAGFLLLSDDDLPALEDRGDTVVSERPQFAPAPDFTFQPDEAAQEAEAADIGDLQPIRLEEFTGESPATPPEPTTVSFIPESLEEEEPDTVEVEPLVPDEDAVVDADALASEDEAEPGERSLEDEIAAELASQEPEDMSHIEFAGSDLEAELMDLEAGVASLDTEPAAGIETDETGDDPSTWDSHDSGTDAGLDDLIDELEGIEPMSLDEFGASDADVTSMPAGFFEDADIDFDIRIEDPDAVQIGGGPPKTSPGIFAAGGSLSDGSGLASDDFPELPEVDDAGDQIIDDDDGLQTVILEQPDNLDIDHDIDIDAVIDVGEPEDSQPAAPEPVAPSAPPATPAPVSHGTGFTRLLGELGDEGLAPFDPARTETGLPGRLAPNAAGDESAGAPSLADGWDDIDAELASAIPPGIAGTDELLGLEDLGLEPFMLDDEDMDQVSAMQPAQPRVETPPAFAGADDAQAAALEPEAESAADPLMDPGHDLPGLQPFAIEEFDDLTADEPFSFGVLPWERQDADDGELDIDIDGLIDEPAPTEQPPATTAGPEDGGAPVGTDTDDEYVDPSLEITRELGSGTTDPNFEHRMAEVEAAARQNLKRMQREHGGGGEPVSAADVPPDALEPPGISDLLTNPTAERLVGNEGLFERSRTAKQAMVSQGVIRGDREIEVEPEDTVSPDIAPSADQPEPTVVEHEPAAEPARPERGPESDIAALRLTLETNPHDDDARWELAEALRERGEIHAAFSEYRWLIRHSPGRHNAVISALETCAQQNQEADLAHRLLADIYRRRGDSSQARNHASMAMATRRLMREIRM